MVLFLKITPPRLPIVTPHLTRVLCAVGPRCHTTDGPLRIACHITSIGAQNWQDELEIVFSQDLQNTTNGALRCRSF